MGCGSSKLAELQAKMDTELAAFKANADIPGEKSYKMEILINTRMKIVKIFRLSDTCYT